MGGYLTPTPGFRDGRTPVRTAQEPTGANTHRPRLKSTQVASPRSACACLDPATRWGLCEGRRVQHARGNFHVHSFQGSFFPENHKKPWGNGWCLKRTMVERRGINPWNYRNLPNMGLWLWETHFRGRPKKDTPISVRKFNDESTSETNQMLPI